MVLLAYLSHSLCIHICTQVHTFTFAHRRICLPMHLCIEAKQHQCLVHPDLFEIFVFVFVEENTFILQGILTMTQGSLVFLGKPIGFLT